MQTDNAAAPVGSGKLITVYEDGTRFEEDPETWLGMNERSEEAQEIYCQLLDGGTVTVGGGAQPLCRMWLE